MENPLTHDVPRQRQPAQTNEAFQSIDIQEHHHRIRNNLHILSCNLLLRARQTQDPETRNLLSSTARQIDSIGRIHSCLYAETQSVLRSSRQYLSGLLKDLHAVLIRPDVDRQFILASGDDFTLENELLVAIGTTVVELVTNAVKYTTGNVQISLCRYERRIAVCVEDEGPGFPVDFDPMRAGFGFRMALHLCSRFGGTVIVDREVRYGSVIAIFDTFSRSSD